MAMGPGMTFPSIFKRERSVAFFKATFSSPRLTVRGTQVVMPGRVKLAWRPQKGQSLVTSLPKLAASSIRDASLAFKVCFPPKDLL